MKSNLLPPGQAPGFSRLKSQPGVFRCKLWPVVNKRDPKHADYHGLLQLANSSKADVLLWIHQDGSLGLRVQLLKKD
jgi:hypothetical protein